MGREITVQIRQGQYEVGDDSIANASPRHRRLIDAEFWIDVRPVSVNEFTRFVIGGGYGSRYGLDVMDPANPVRVDQRCEEIYRHSTPSAAAFQDKDRPATGLTWFEAVAVARFFGARLPFEAEWEIAMRHGAALASSSLSEWTADAYAPKYWRADFQTRGVPWTPEHAVAEVCVRGRSQSSLANHLTSRYGGNPREGERARTFRRVWDRVPEE